MLLLENANVNIAIYIPNLPFLREKKDCYLHISVIKKRNGRPQCIARTAPYQRDRKEARARKILLLA